MRNIIRPLTLLALGSLLALLTACSSDKQGDQPVLAHVPADTAWVFANLEPIKPGVRDAWMASANAQLPMQVRQYRDQARMLRDDAPTMASLLSALADELDGKTWQQIVADAGVDLGGHFASYGIGLSPVVRGQLSDPVKFQAFIDRMGKAVEKPLPTARVGDVNYQHLDMPEVQLQFVVAHYHKQFVLALLPMGKQDGTLRLALGIDMPKVQDTVVSRLTRLADEQGYQPQALGYLDTGALLAELSSGQDPLLNAIRASEAGKKDEDLHTALGEFSSPACKADLKRMAARVPQISFGATHLDARRADQRMNISLAPDITAAFDGVSSPLPGLGGLSGAPAEFAIALPLPAIRDFWTAQAQAVAAQPFTCKPLTGLNKAFEQIGQKILTTAIPPFGNLRGIHVAIDQISMTGDKQAMPDVQARAVVAMKDPESVVAMAKAMLKPLEKLDLKPDGKLVQLPSSLSQFTNEPIWLAMNDHALVVGIGAEEKGRLQAALTAKTGSSGQLATASLDGTTLAKWIRAAGEKYLPDADSDKVAGKDADKDADNRLRATHDMHDSIEAAAKSYESMKHIGFDLRMTKQSLVLESRAQLEP